MVRQLNSGRSKIQNGGRRAQSEQDPCDRNTKQLRGIRTSLELSRRVAHEPGTQVRVVVTL